MRFDEAVKEILQSTHPRLLEHLSGSAVRSWLNVELPQTQMRRIDLLADLANGGLFHLELQTRNDPKIGRRLLNYSLMIEDALERVPEQMVLYIGWEPLRMPAVLIRPNLRFTFAVADIRDLNPGALAKSSRIEDRILSILFGHGDAKPRAMLALHEISRMEHPERGDALAKLLVTSGLRRLNEEIRREIEHMPLLSDILDNPFLQDWFKEGEAKGVLIGEAKGIQIGEANGGHKGRAAEAARFITQLLERRFGPLPAWAKERIEATPPETLESALDQVLEAATLEQALQFPPAG